MLRKRLFLLKTINEVCRLLVRMSKNLSNEIRASFFAEGTSTLCKCTMDKNVPLRSSISGLKALRKTTYIADTERIKKKNDKTKERKKKGRKIEEDRTPSPNKYNAKEPSPPLRPLSLFAQAKETTTFLYVLFVSVSPRLVSQKKSKGLVKKLNVKYISFLELPTLA